MAGWRVAEGGGTSLRANVFTQGSPAAGGPGPPGGELAPPATFGTGGTPHLRAWDFCVQIPALPLPSWVALGTLLNPPRASVSSPVPQSVPRAHCPCRLVVHPLLRGPTRVLRVRTGTRGHCWPPRGDRHARLSAGWHHLLAGTARGGPGSEGLTRRLCPFLRHPRSLCPAHHAHGRPGPWTPLCSRFGGGVGERGLTPALSHAQGWEVGREPPAWREAHLLTSEGGPVIAASAVT